MTTRLPQCKLPKMSNVVGITIITLPVKSLKLSPNHMLSLLLIFSPVSFRQETGLCFQLYVLVYLSVCKQDPTKCPFNHVGLPTEMPFDSDLGDPFSVKKNASVGDNLLLYLILKRNSTQAIYLASNDMRLNEWGRYENI